jgi:ATP phosphoribosyltransferase
MTIKLGVPSKGRLMDKTFEWFGARGISLARSGSEREYAGVVEGIDGVSLVLLSAGEIPRELAAGRIHLGVTGTDLVHEKLALWDQSVLQVAELGFGHADLIIAVPQGWTDVDTLHDLDAAAAAFRVHHGRRMRIATKYHRLVREFLRAAGVAEYALVDRGKRDGGGHSRHHFHGRNPARQPSEDIERWLDPALAGDAVEIAGCRAGPSKTEKPD